MDEAYVDPGRLPHLTLARDVSPADWLVAELRPWGPPEARVGCFVPASYAAHVRVLHPAGGTEPRWAELARRRGVALGPSTSFAEASGFDEEDDRLPSDGTLPPAELDVLRGLLAASTGTPDRLWLAYWAGFGSWGGGVAFDVPDGASSDEVARLAREAYRRAAPRHAYLAAIPRVRLPHREYFLFHGSLSAPLESFSVEWDGPNLWWPEDRAWCVATEIDGYDTYVACGAAAAEEILASADLEAIRVTPEDAASY